jgi:type I restriction enzyme S subunit
MIKRGITPRYLENSGIRVLCVRNHEISFELGRRHDVQAKPVDPERYVRVGDVLINSTGTGILVACRALSGVPCRDGIGVVLEEI